MIYIGEFETMDTKKQMEILKAQNKELFEVDGTWWWKGDAAFDPRVKIDLMEKGEEVPYIVY